MQEVIDNISSEKLQTASIKNMATFYSIYGRGEGGGLVSTPSDVVFIPVFRLPYLMALSQSI